MYRSFSDLVPTPNAVVRCRQYYLDRSSVQVSEELIGSSGTSDVFRGYLDNHIVAVKRLRVDFVENLDAALKDLVSEIDFMCRYARFVYFRRACLCPYRRSIRQSNRAIYDESRAFLPTHAEVWSIQTL